MPNTKEKIVLIGGGGHAKVVIDAIKKEGKFDIYGIVDPVLARGTSVMGISVLGSDDELENIFAKKVKYASIGIGSIDNSEARKRIYRNLKSIGFELPAIKHPSASIGEHVLLGEGTFVAAGAVINPSVKIGKNAIVNTRASIDHDCEIGDFVHIAPGATLSGGVRVGDETHIGTGANVVQYRTIGKECMIGAGRTIRHDKGDRFRDIDKSDGHPDE